MKEEDENENLKMIRISTLQRFIKTMENQIFSFFYAILEDKEEYFYFTFLAITITFVQAMGFAFRDNVNKIYSRDFFNKFIIFSRNRTSGNQIFLYM